MEDLRQRAAGTVGAARAPRNDAAKRRQSYYNKSLHQCSSSWDKSTSLKRCARQPTTCRRHGAVFVFEAVFIVLFAFVIVVVFGTALTVCFTFVIGFATAAFTAAIIAIICMAARIDVVFYTTAIIAIICMATCTIRLVEGVASIGVCGSCRRCRTPKFTPWYSSADRR